MLQGSPVKGRARRPELVVLVSHAVAKRGWSDVKQGEVCKIPGIGPVAPAIAKEIARDAFLSGVFYDGVDLRHFRRWTPNVPVEVRIALELGEPPDFDGVRCRYCGNASGTKQTTSSPTSPEAPRPMTTSGPGAGAAIRPRPSATRETGKLRPRAAEH
jgi:hypothetical protein